MGIFSGAGSVKQKVGNNFNEEDREFFADGTRRVEIEKALLRISTNEGSKNFGQAMIIVEFKVHETFEGEEQTSTKAIEVLAKAPNGKWLKRGEWALRRVRSLIAAACGVEDVTEDTLEALFPVPEDGKFSEAEALAGVEVIAETTTFHGDTGSLTTTTYRAL